MAAAVPAVYALTRFVWMVYPLGIDRELWASGRSELVAGVWLGRVRPGRRGLTIGLTRPWGRAVPRWMPRLGGRRVPVAAAVVPACAVALLVVSAGADRMLLTVLDNAIGREELADELGSGRARRSSGRCGAWRWAPRRWATRWRGVGSR